MRYAIVSDIHANLQAWYAVLMDMADMASSGVSTDHIVCLGDIVGYGPAPSAVLKEIRQKSTVVVIGNHDAAVCGRMDASIFNENAREVVEWSTDQLSADDLTYLDRLPAKVRLEGTDFLAVHSEVVDPLAFGYILTEEDARHNFAACNDRIVFIGHTHKAGVFELSHLGEVSSHDPLDFRLNPESRYIINPGSVGDPRCSQLVASYLIYDDETNDVFFRRVEFDTEAYRNSINATSLVARPFFIRYLDDTSQGHLVRAFPSVVKADRAPLINLGPAEMVIKKKNPAAKIAVFLLLASLAGVAWFFISTSSKKSALADVNTERVKASSNINKPAQVIKKTVTDKLPVRVRWIQISLPRKGFLCIDEVEIFSNGVNIARQGKATQSSNYNGGGTADKAIDGVRTGRWDDEHMSHTNGEDFGWWLIDLGKSYEVEKVVIWNRNEGEELFERLDDFTLEMLDQDKQRVFLRKNNSGKMHRILVN